MALSDKRLKMWRNRLRLARAAMAREGIIDSPGAQGSRVSRELVAMYAGDAEAHFGGDQDWCDQEDWQVVNKVFQAANQLDSEIAAQRPDVQLMPRGGVNRQESIQRAGKAIRVVQPLISWDIDELDMEQQHNEALLDSFFYPCGWVRVGFTPEDEGFFTDDRRLVGGQKRLSPIRMERPNRPWLRRIPPWDVIPDPDSTSFTPDGGMKWVAFRSVQTIESVKRNPRVKDLSGEQVEQLLGGVRHPLEPVRARSGRHVDDDSPDAPDLVEVHTVYDAMNRTWFQIHLESGTLLRDEADWPIAWEWLPVRALVLNPRRDGPWGVPALAASASIQRELNHVRTMMSWLVRTIRRLVAINSDKLVNGEDVKLETAQLTEIIRVKGDVASAISVIQSGGFPQELLAYEGLLDKDLRESLGTSQMGRGQRINVDTATEAAGVQGGQDVHMARFARAYEKFWRETLRLFLQTRRETFDPNGVEVVPLLGVQDAAEAVRWASVSAAEIQADLDFVIVPGSTRRRDRAQEEARAMAALMVANENPAIFNVAYYAQRLAQIQGVSPEEAFTVFAETAGQLQGVRQVVDNATPGVEGGQPAANPQALALALGGGGGR